jgi:hypothetical protein
LRNKALELGLGVSTRSVQRILRGEVQPVESFSEGESAGGYERRRAGPVIEEGPVLALGEQETARIADILRRAAGAQYIEVEDLRLESRPGEISLKARVYEPEEEYE